MKISFSAGKRNKIHISVDGEYFITVDSEYWYSCPYCKLSVIEGDEEIDAFYSAVGSRCAFNAALNLLSYSDNSRKTLLRKLTAKGHRREYVLAALDRLEELGYVDDARYAANTAERLQRAKHMSRAGIIRELLAKGVDRAVAEQAVQELEIDPALEIKELLEGKYQKYLSDEKGIRKTIAALQRLGYSYSDIRDALYAVSEESE